MSVEYTQSKLRPQFNAYQERKEELVVEEVMDRCRNNLPDDILALIAQRLDSVIDLLRFRSTCKSWRYSSMTIQQYSTYIRNKEKEFEKLPRLYIDFYTKAHYNIRSIHNSYWFCIGTYYAVKHNSSNKAFVASMTENCPGEMVIFPINPNLGVVSIEGSRDKFATSFKKLKLNMLEQSLSEVGQFYTMRPIDNTNTILFRTKFPVQINKVAIIRSKLPDHNNYVIVALCAIFGHLAILNSNQKKWMVQNNFRGFKDITTRSGGTLIYAVDNSGRLVKVDLSSQVTQVVAKSGIPGMQKHLVESRVELLLLNWYVNVSPRGNGMPSETKSCFKIYKLNEVSRKWIAVTSLGDQVIVLDSAVCFSAPYQDLGLSRGNCICYKKDCRVLTHTCTNGARWICFWSGAPVPALYNFNYR